jgi:hypothetical protein
VALNFPSNVEQKLYRGIPKKKVTSHTEWASRKSFDELHDKIWFHILTNELPNNKQRTCRFKKANLFVAFLSFELKKYVWTLLLNGHYDSTVC